MSKLQVRDSRPPTPDKRKLADLPPLSDCEDNQGDISGSDSELTPLELSATGHLFTENLIMDDPLRQNPDFADLTPSQLYELNQNLLNDSVPTRPLIDVVAPMAILRAEYENGSSAFLKQIDWLIDNGYDSFRRTRGDGDCFYRSLAFAYIEGLINSSDKELAVGTSLSALSSTKDTLDSAGIEKMVYEDFYDVLAELIQCIIQPNREGKTLTDASLLESFQSPEVSNSIVIYLRFLTSAQIRLNKDAYEGFVCHPDTKDPMDVESFCSNIVQAMGKEADNVEIEALCRALQLSIDVAYLNGSGGVTDFIKFRNDPDTKASPLVLLYRPGHYDILIHKDGRTKSQS